MQLEAVILRRDVGDKRVVLVAQRLLPRPVVDPSELPIYPDAELERLTLCVVLLPDVGVVDVSDAVVAVEADEQTTVAHRQNHVASLTALALDGGVEAMVQKF